MRYTITELDVMISTSSDYYISSDFVWEKRIYDETHVLGHHNRGFLNIVLQVKKTVILYIK
jgi:hypothetical protein